MIDEKKLIENIKHECNLNAGGLYEEDIVRIIKKQPKISLENKTSDKWIPVSEKLPEDVYPNKQIINVLVTNDKGNVRKVQRRFDGYPEKVWHWSHYTDAVAWMPLPPKYEG